jgi:hypothetical protein
MYKYTRSGHHYVDSPYTVTEQHEPGQYCRCLELDGVLCERCDPAVAAGYRQLADTWDRDRATVIEALGQIDGFPCVTLDMLAAQVDLEQLYVWKLLRGPIRRGEVAEYQEGDTFLYGLPGRMCLSPFPNVPCTVPTVLEAAAR